MLIMKSRKHFTYVNTIFLIPQHTYFLSRPVVKQLIAEIVPHGVFSGFLQKSTKIAMQFSVLQCSSIHFHEPGRISLGGRDGELGQLYTITQHAVITKSEYFTSVYEVMLIVIRHETIISFVYGERIQSAMQGSMSG